MPSIPLTKGQYAFVDDQDYDLLMQWQWQVSSNGYAVRTTTIDGRRKRIFMHRAIMDAEAGQIVDHISGDRLDNRRCNLRVVTRNQNQWNRCKNRRSRSAYKGVSRHARGWHVRIAVNGRRYHLGYYSEAQSAAQMYDAAAYYFFGSAYARVNFPGKPVRDDVSILLHGLLLREILASE